MRLFISYAHVDRYRVRELVEIFRVGGHDPWFDHRLLPGEDWKAKLLAEVRACDAFVYALTPESVASTWCQWEFAKAVELGKPILPVLLQDKTKLPDALSRYQYADFTNGPTAEATARLLGGLWQATVTIPAEDAPAPPPEPTGPPPQAVAADPPPPAGNVDEAIDAFFAAYDAQQWQVALNRLGRLRGAAGIPAFFSVADYEQEIQGQLVRVAARRKRDRDYGIIKRMAKRTPDRAWTALRQFWGEYPGHDPDDLDARLNPARPWLDVINDPETPPQGRAEAGRKLAELGDPRPGVGLRSSLPARGEGQGGVSLPDIDWVEIPGGPFLMGSTTEQVKALQEQSGKDWFDNELPQRTIDLPAFSIARYPVTYAQYEAFVNAGGYAERVYWTEAGWQEKGDRTAPTLWNDPQWHVANHPVVGVTWYEAYAFCAWLSEQTGERIVLPTEAQWEKAARGTEGRIYPWGDEFDGERVNWRESGIGQMSAVGMYPQGMSPYGLLDMSGNVWEWCQTKWRDSYADPEDNDAEGTAPRVLRGGSWGNSDTTDFRAADRYWGTPHFRSYNWGFRAARL